MQRSGRLAVCAIAFALIGVCAVPALAHQTAYNKGVGVTLHVTPDDEPVAGRSSKIAVTRVRAGSYRFSWRTCVCYLRVTDSRGAVVLNRRAGRTIRFTFPRASAYTITFSGRVKRNGRTKRFRVSFAIRAG